MSNEGLVAALNSFAQIERGIVEFGAVGDTSRALELVRLRKQMVSEFATLGQALEADPYLNAHGERKTEILRLFSAFRSANAINTAEWPAIRVRDELEGFRAAARQVAQASRAFWEGVGSLPGPFARFQSPALAILR